MRSKYLRQLLELLSELDRDYRNDKLDVWGNSLRQVIKIVLVAFWFFQIDELHGHMAAWRIRVGNIVMQDVSELSENFLLVEMAEQAAAEIEAEEKAGQSSE